MVSLPTLLTLWGSTYTFPEKKYERIRARTLVPATLSLRSRVVGEIFGPIDSLPQIKQLPSSLHLFGEVVAYASYTGPGVGTRQEEWMGNRYGEGFLLYKPSKNFSLSIGVYESFEGRESVGTLLGITVYDLDRVGFSVRYYQGVGRWANYRTDISFFSQSNSAYIYTRAKISPGTKEGMYKVEVGKEFFDNRLVLSLGGEGYVDGKKVWEFLSGVARVEDGASIAPYIGVGTNFNIGPIRVDFNAKTQPVGEKPYAGASLSVRW